MQAKSVTTGALTLFLIGVACGSPFDERMIPDDRLPAIIAYIKSLQDGN